MCFSVQALQQKADACWCSGVCSLGAGTLELGTCGDTEELSLLELLPLGRESGSIFYDTLTGFREDSARSPARPLGTGVGFQGLLSLKLIFWLSPRHSSGFYSQKK